MFGIRSTAIILFAALAYFLFLWKTVGPATTHFEASKEVDERLHHIRQRVRFIVLFLGVSAIIAGWFIQPTLELWTIGSVLIIVAMCTNATSKTLTFFANATLIYPLIFLGLLYGEWFLAWYMLGHPPSPYGDNDPAQIDGAGWMWPITGIAFIGLMPASIGAVICTIAFVMKNRPSAAQVGIRLLTLVSFWLGMHTHLMSDPYKVIYWWLD